MTLFPRSSASAEGNMGSPGIDKLPNELLVRVLTYVSEDRKDLWAFLLTQRRWFSIGIDQIWMRPVISSPSTLNSLCAALKTDANEYAPLIRRLNLGSVARHVNTNTLAPFLVCHDLERLALANAVLETEDVLIELLKRNPHLSSIDISGVHVTDRTLEAIAHSCPSLHGLYATNCVQITDLGVSQLAASCKYLRRLKIAGSLISPRGLQVLMENCPYMLELDISQCGVNDELVLSLLQRFTLLRELRLNGNIDISTDVLANANMCENLRLIDFGGCPNISDSTVERLVQLAPRLHQVVLGKCYNVTNRSLHALATLEQNLHFVHLGHCTHITDEGIGHLARSCPRLQYVDVANCARLTNLAVTYISKLPRLRRVGLVKCTQINDQGIFWLSKRAPTENTLERIHLSYCNNVGFEAVASLINNCPRLTHLSLTGVTAFLRPDLAQFCRTPPADLNQHQQSVFCVFSGSGVSQLRNYINRRVPIDPTRTPFPSITTPARVAQLAQLHQDEEQRQNPPSMRAPLRPE